MRPETLINAIKAFPRALYDETRDSLTRDKEKLRQFPYKAAKNIGSALVDSATENDILGLRFRERMRQSTGKEIPYKNNAITEALESTRERARNKVEEAKFNIGTDLEFIGRTEDPRNKEYKALYREQLPLTPYGKQVYDELNVNIPSDMLTYQRLKGEPGHDTHSAGLALPYSSIDSLPIPDKAKQWVAKKLPYKGIMSKWSNEVLLHELSHHVDKQLKIQEDPGFQRDFSEEYKNNPDFRAYVDWRAQNYPETAKENTIRINAGQEPTPILPVEMYTIATEYIDKAMRGTLHGPRAIPRRLAPYFPHIEIDKEMLSSR